MIAPLPPQTQSPKPADPTGAAPAPREGDGFADILAAAASAVPPPRIPGPPTLDHGPAVMRLADIQWDPVAAPATPTPTPIQAGLTDPAIAVEAPRGDQPQPAARVFNQDGFFGASVDAPLSDSVSADASRGQGEPGIPSVAATAALPLGIAPVATPPSTAASTTPGSSARTGSESAAIRASAQRLPAGALATPLPTRGITAAGDAESEAVRPLARRFALREPGERTPVHVAIRELEQGLHVAARVEGLDAADRVRLHDEISALLARHGRSARNIRITAPLPAASQEKPK